MERALNLVKDGRALGVRVRLAARIAAGLARVRLGGARVPLFASIELTRRCDGRCLYCRAPRSRGRDLPREAWEAIIDDLAESGTVRVSFTGGEPLLRPDLPDLAAHCARRGIEVEVNTNGRLLPGALPALGTVSYFTLSLDGIEEVNDRIRGKGAYAGVMAAWRAARAASVPAGFLSVLSPPSIARLPEYLDLIHRERLPVLFQPLFERYLRSDRLNPDQPVTDEVRRAVDLIARAKSDGDPIRNSAASLAYMRMWPGPAPIDCGGGRYFVRITSTGRMEVCGLKGDDTPPGIDARDGVVRGMARMGTRSCGWCWCTGRTELNLALMLDPAALRYVARTALFRGSGGGRAGR